MSVTSKKPIKVDLVFDGIAISIALIIISLMIFGVPFLFGFSGLAKGITFGTATFFLAFCVFFFFHELSRSPANPCWSYWGISFLFFILASIPFFIQYWYVSNYTLSIILKVLAMVLVLPSPIFAMIGWAAFSDPKLPRTSLKKIEILTALSALLNIILTLILLAEKFI